ncbi:MAG: phosphate signaling complex PhoU family protein [Planctomycetota bacterium]|jgi:phosphate transport system protein
MVTKDNGKVQRLTQDLIALAELVERNVDTAVMALVDDNSRFAYEVISLDADIDEMEVFIDRECLELLSGQESADEDFRFLAAAMKINNDLERIGNQAVTIAEQVLALIHTRGRRSDRPDLSNMLERVEVMVRQSVEALLTRDADLAWQIWEEHAGAEEDLRRVMGGLGNALEKRPAGAVRAMHLARAVMALATVSEYTKDIAEEVIYMREGIIVKHHEREFRGRRKPAVAETAESD